MTKKFRKLLKVVNEEIVPFTEKNYYKRVVTEKGKTLESDLNGPQKAQCYALGSPVDVCGFPAK
jgi:hypothetical protein